MFEYVCQNQLQLTLSAANTYSESPHVGDFITSAHLPLPPLALRGSIFVSAVHRRSVILCYCVAIKMRVTEWRISSLHCNVILHVLPPVSQHSSLFLALPLPHQPTRPSICNMFLISEGFSLFSALLHLLIDKAEES